MLKTNKIELVISSSNYKRYMEKYGPYKKNDIIIVDVEDLSVNSIAKVIAICKFCGIEKELKYQTYKIQFDKGSYYCCSKCATKKQKQMMKQNGSSYYLSNPEYKNKMMELYGVDNPSKINEIKEIRSKRLSNDEYQQKMIDGVINKYGVDNVSKIDSIKEQKKTNMFKKLWC